MAEWTPGRLYVSAVGLEIGGQKLLQIVSKEDNQTVHAYVPYEDETFDLAVARAKHFAAAPDYDKALTDHESPQLWRIERLADLLDAIEGGTFEDDWAEDPDAAQEMLDELRAMYTDCKVALAKARGEQS